MLSSNVRPNASPSPRIGVVTSRGLRRVGNLARFLDLDEVLSPAELARSGHSAHCVLAWGRKPSARRAESLALELGVPLIRVEDGWIRSASPDAHAPSVYSLLVDETGVYYDAGAPSAIERFLADDEAVAAACTEEAMRHSAALRRRIVDLEITKYNYCRRAAVPQTPFVLVIDQTLGDASVDHGAMDRQRFVEMLDAAIRENPSIEVLVRSHPDVVAGRRSGYLMEAAIARGVRVCPGDDNPMTWLKRAERVYVGTSQLGYEALLAERPVSVFGLPFYAGWGLTTDRQAHPRRNAVRSVDELFHAAHERLARYVSPVTGNVWTLSDCIDHVHEQQRMFARNARDHLCIGITRWKQGYLADYLKSPDGSVRFGRPAHRRPTDAMVTWSFRRMPERGPDESSALIRVEDGFVRSSGLGSDFVAPGSLVFDASGLYFDSSAPSDLEMLLGTHDCTAAELARAARLRELLLEGALTKYNLGTDRLAMPVPDDQRIVLVTGQVEDDESIKRGTAEVSTNTALLQSVRKRCPGDWIVYRPHPDVQSGNRCGRVDEFTLQSCADAIDEGSAITELIESADEVHTMTSLTGFEALLRGTPVVTWGSPFYAGWGLTIDQGSLPRRTRKRTLEELVFLTLIAYPRYLDPRTGEFIDAETQAMMIARHREEHTASRWGRRSLMRARNLMQGLRHAA